MIKNKITKKQSKIAYISSVVMIFVSLCIIPTIGLFANVEKFQCDGCGFFNNLLVSAIGIIAWSIFYGVFHTIFFSQENAKPSNLSKIYSNFLQHSIKDKKIQSASVMIVMVICYLLIFRFLISQLLVLINGI